MDSFSATRAKQCFGQLLAAAAIGPVAIERHGKVLAMVAAPEFLNTAPLSQDAGAARRQARLNQALLEKDRLIRHQRIALDLATLPAKARNPMIERARGVVDRWRRERLCSSDYIDRWTHILELPASEMALAMVSDADPWGPALRQNSPWVGVRA